MRVKKKKEGRITPSSWDPQFHNGAECLLASEFLFLWVQMTTLTSHSEVLFGAQMQDNGKKRENAKRWFCGNISEY